MNAKNFLWAVVLAASGLIMACSNDSNDNEEMTPELVIGTREGDDGEEVATWPSEEEMASPTYYPIGTKWQEV